MPEGHQSSAQALGLESLLSPPCLEAGRAVQSCLAQPTGVQAVWDRASEGFEPFPLSCREPWGCSGAEGV